MGSPILKGYLPSPCFLSWGLFVLVPPFFNVNCLVTDYYFKIIIGGPLSHCIYALFEKKFHHQSVFFTHYPVFPFSFFCVLVFS